ncbi:hypothetical protein Metvu_1677 [Methanocaldococcus vulcanius M7]|uniref:Uncharacterized protein n=1 Tax=Methanocaldococcus vulcanius (strain ATCC 700851 / DSM 12094 / M7) TaxID=579137 RepID=C9RE01_METVM|nr:hypothetical protein [Methanocaldococcus vulcanius]ACX73530.1 hypothetical protein Metvu_1677 [Methanocaldococcus vulcanius M7]
MRVIDENDLLNNFIYFVINGNHKEQIIILKTRGYNREDKIIYFSKSPFKSLKMFKTNKNMNFINPDININSKII